MDYIQHNNISNCNSESDRLFLHVEKFIPTRRKNISYAYAQNILSKALIILLLMTVGSIGVWGQDTTDGYSGTYYIGSVGYNADKPEENYYLCPTEGWCYYEATNDFTGTDNGKPFLTTYQCRNGKYEAKKAVWFIEKAPEPNSEYYYIKQASTGKYLTSNGTIRTTGNADRMRVHLETVAPENLDDKELFTIATYSNYLTISPKGVVGGAADRNWLTVNGGNKPSLKGESGKGNGPTGYTNTAGIIGIYTQNDANAKFYLEEAASIDPPVITNNFNGTVTITAAPGATIYYTTNGVDPTTSTTTSGPSPITVNLDENITVIKALAKATNENIPTTVVTHLLPKCATPKIEVRRNIVTITCEDPASASIYYAIATDAEPTTAYTIPFEIDNNVPIVKAIAKKDGYINSEVSTYNNNVITVHSSSEISDMTGSYILAADFTSAASIGIANNPFKGIIDGSLITLSGLDHALVAYADGATIKNVFLDNVSISGGTNVGAICNEATGDTRIYNCGILASNSTVKTDEKGYTTITSCSSTISGSGYVGGIVGLLDGSARVINCFSYANITGGSHVGGIVGYNNYETKADDAEHLKTMVMNCMFYGDITGGTSKAPIYNGIIITNKDLNTGVGNYNYFWSGASYVKNKNIDVYNCALSAETRFLQRFEFFRHFLNGNRRLAAWWATGNSEDQDLMLKWVLEPSQIGTPTPYPILKEQGKYLSVVNIDVNHSEIGKEVVGTVVGSLTVNIQNGSGAVYSAPAGASITTSSLSLKITDKDPAHFNYNYHKVQLPFYNDVGSKNYTGNRVVTGWKIVKINGETTGTGTFTSGEYDVTRNQSGDVTKKPYDFADRSNTNKDLYSVSGRVFSQGAYFDVPEGVNSITIEPYWAKAVYASDDHLDIVYNQDMNNRYVVSRVGGGQLFTNDSEMNINGSNQKVYNSITNARNALFNGVTATSHSVNDYAIVLVGHCRQNGINGEKKYPHTLMSIDLDQDNEPDYSLVLRFDSRAGIHPVKFDFLNILGLGMAQKSTGGTGSYNFGIMQPMGWFECTNTALFRVTQFEYSSPDKDKRPIIMHGGVIEQWVSFQNKAPGDKIEYFHVGSNVWFKEFHLGVHQDKTFATPHPPVSVTGGDYDIFYLTGAYRADAENWADDAECYINGGNFGVVAGAGMEGIGNESTHAKGNINWFIDNADIKEFYGGGINAAKPIQGNINTVISNSRVTEFYGGPKFGDMENGRTVKTIASNNCVFGSFFGAGYGGNSYSRRAPYNQNNVKNNVIGDYGTWNNWVSQEYKQDYDATHKGISTKIEYQYIPMSNNTTSVARLFVDYVRFSLATTREVTSELTNCTVTDNFYGGGRLGKVDGPVTSTLTGCTVGGSVYGAGFSAALPPVKVMQTGGFKTEPFYDTNLGAYLDAEFPDYEPVDFTWKHRDEEINSTARGIDKTNHWLYTNEDLNTLGTVTGKVTLNIESGTTVTGSVYGGGESSDVYGKNTSDEITSEVEVNIKGGSMTDVYGGGYGANTVVGGDVEVNIGVEADGVYTGEATVNGDVYGGSAMGAVNASSTKDVSTGNVTGYTALEGKTTTVNVLKGTVNGSVYGGGLGDNTNQAKVFGNTTVNIGAVAEGATPTSVGNVFGGSNVNGISQEDVIVNIIRGSIGSNSSPGKVHGGGEGKLTLVKGNVTVNMGSKSADATPVFTGVATVNGDVYGGSAFGNTNAYKNSENVLIFSTDKTTTVNLYKGTITGDVYGGGLGQQKEGTSGQPGYKEAIEAFVGGDVTVELNKDVPDNQKGCVIGGSIFGANNANGTPKGAVTVHIYKTQNASAEHITIQEGDTDPGTKPKVKGRYDVEAVYGGGNQAAYNPTIATGTDAQKAEAYTRVIIDGCDRTSINYVYGGGNAAPVPGTDVTINGTYDINYVFGGGNGAGNNNPGADVGIIDQAEYATNNANGRYGLGIAKTKLIGGTITYVYGGSNTKGNVVGGTSLTMPSSNDCTLNVKEIYGAGQNAEQSGGVEIILGCMEQDNNRVVYGGAKNADVGGDLDMVITSGHFKQVFGGNNTSGAIRGQIRLTIEETACDPVTIDDLYLGGNLAPYSIYGYYIVKDGNGNPVYVYDDGKPKLQFMPRTSADDTHKPVKSVTYPTGEGYPTYTEYSGTGDDKYPQYKDPVLEIHSCTSINNVFGGGYGESAIMYGSPTVNINQIFGKTYSSDTHTREYYSEEATTLGVIKDVFGGGNLAPVIGNTTINIGNKQQIQMMSEKTSLAPNEQGGYTPLDIQPQKSVLGANITGNVYGGGNQAAITGNTQVNICTEYDEEEAKYIPVEEGNAKVIIAGDVFGAGNGLATDVKSAIVRGNSFVYMGDGWVKKSIYGGGALASVGDFTYDNNDITACATNTGKSTVHVFGGKVGPASLIMPNFTGHVFGAGKGALGADALIPKLNYVQSTDVTISDEAFIKGSVYGGAEDGHVRGDTYVKIKGGQIGCGYDDSTNGQGDLDRIYTPEEWAYDVTTDNTKFLYECNHWPYTDPYKPYDKYANDYDSKGGAVSGTDGHTFYGNVFGGGSGFEPYAAGQWLESAGDVQGNTKVEITGGHILTSIYGGNELTDVEGNCEVSMSGGTLGVPRTIEQINNHPVTCYLFGAGKGDQRILFNQKTNIQDATVNVTGGWIYGSVFGGGEDGHILGNVTMNIGEGAKIGTWGCSYVDGNIFGGGRGFAGDALTAGVVCGNVNINITGGEMLGSIYGGGRLGSVGTYLVPSNHADYGNLIPNGKKQELDVENGTVTLSDDEDVTHGNITINISGGTIGNNFEYIYPTAEQKAGDLRFTTYDPTSNKLIHSKGGNVFTGCMGRRLKLDGTEIDRWQEMGKARSTTLTITGGTIKSNVYGGSEFGRVEGNSNVSISGESTTIGTAIGSGANLYYFGSVYGGGMGEAGHGGGDIDDGNGTSNTSVSVTDGHVVGNVYGGCEVAHVMGGTSVTISGSATIGIETSADTSIGNVFGGGQEGDVHGSVEVNMTGGTVINDVYGGGALAHTNVYNWDSTKSDYVYVNVPVTVDEETDANSTNVTGLYEYNHETEEYTITLDSKAQKDKLYYQQNTTTGTWADGKNNDTTNKTTYNTTVNISGGILNNVYGGGLGRIGVSGGQTAVEATVYGDVTVTVNGSSETGATNNAKFRLATEDTNTNVNKSGRVFGCNNLNGTPKGNVTVTVWSTTPAVERIPRVKDVEKYDLQAVYGGGNRAEYKPVAGKKTQVNIHGCDETSIEYVFGGGNAAIVPHTDVIIYGSWEIGTVFGGGNGSEPVWDYATSDWVPSPGADVPGTSKVTLKGGYIHSAFGGSYTLGTVGKTILDSTGGGGDEGCLLEVTNVYGGGQKADVNLINLFVTGCTYETNVKNVYAGSYNARVLGGITLTITGGIFSSVFGGNNDSGLINGPITINIQETDDCKPIKITNLYGGGNKAAYPGPINTLPEKEGDPQPYSNPKITINVMSATQIDNIFGGALQADVNGDTEININMTKGSWAGQTYGTEAIPDDIGIIGNVYGGGDRGKVNGNTSVNIGTATKVTQKVVTIGTETIDGKEVTVVTGSTDEEYDVLGANITGYVFGGGNEADVTGNTEVNICAAKTGTPILDDDDQPTGEYNYTYNSVDFTGTGKGVKIGKSVYGGGNLASVGTFTPANSVPTACTENKGTSAVRIMGYAEIGPDNMQMKTASGKPDDLGHVFGASRGTVYFKDIEGNYNPEVLAAMTAQDKLNELDKTAFADNTEVLIGGHAFIKGSVYGGSENGHVLNDTHVTIQDDCQIGNGDGVNRRYTTAEWAYDGSDDAHSLPECAHWDYGHQIGTDSDDKPIKEYLSYDLYKDTNNDGKPDWASDGHTFYGNVFGGGSGYYPYEEGPELTEIQIKDGYSKGVWLRHAGEVMGNTIVDVKGGHILTSLYGGNEQTDVLGSCTVNMSGGTLGVPRTESQIAAHPVTCYVFGAGKGDQRVNFNTWTNVQSTEVNITGTARIFGSVFGGGEDGHILGDGKVNIGESGKTNTGIRIGTRGISYVDGNIFGGGRGFSGDALTAGTVGGNVDVNIYGGTMLGSVYGGGRLASVGIFFTDPENELYGEFHEDGNGKKYGHVTVNIFGGTIGNDLESILVEHTRGGNVYGGSMGRIELLDGTTNPLWPKLGQVKSARVNITGNAHIKGNVYGGGEFGTVRENAYVTVGGILDDNDNETITQTGDPTLERDIYGGGYGSEDYKTETTISAAGYEQSSYTFTPMQWAGCVGGDTYVNVCGGKVKKIVYGGGELASVGIVDFQKAKTQGMHHDIDNEGTSTEKIYGFGLSWPCKLEYVSYKPGSSTTTFGGQTNVNITGGRIGITGKDYMGPYAADGTTPIDKNDGHTLSKDEIKAARIDNGDVFGGGKGKPGSDEASRYDYVFCANVRKSVVKINYENSTATPSTYKDDQTLGCITGSVYGGSENGHVNEDTQVTLTNGLIGHAIYGGGKGKDTFKKELNKIIGSGTYISDVYGVTSGKVYGNTNVTMEGGYVVRNIYGGGNMASIGKGNYSGGSDDYSTNGYGEMPPRGNQSLWTNTEFLNSGKSTVIVTGGTVGTASGEKDGLPYGNVFGGARGGSAPNISESPRYYYCPLFYSGYVNETSVQIGKTGETGPTIYGSVYGGGQDGHVRRDTHVEIISGSIGLEYNTDNITAVGVKDEDNKDVTLNHFKWLHRGNVYGSGSGIGKYEFDFDGDGKFDTNDWSLPYGTKPGTSTPNYVKEVDYSNSAGSVTRFTKVEIKGGTIHRNVYGGGSLATVGPPKISQDHLAYVKDDPDHPTRVGEQTISEVILTGGIVGDESSYNVDGVNVYGGNVFAACRGEAEIALDPTHYNASSFATSIWTKLIVSGTAHVYGDVYGGGEFGSVKQSTDVLLGVLKQENADDITGGTIDHDAYGGGKGIKAAIDGTGGVTADVGLNTNVELNGTTNAADDASVPISGKGCVVGRIFGANNLNGTPKGQVRVRVHATQTKGKASVSVKDAKFEVDGVNLEKGDRTDSQFLEYLTTTLGTQITDATALGIDVTTYTTIKNKVGVTEEELITAITDIRTEMAPIIAENITRYDVKAVYGGGNLATYEPDTSEDTEDDYKKATVIIDGCGLSSIYQVYGGSNAASVPATYLTINGAYEIFEAFGGGNGNDSFDLDGKTFENPGANVGYKDYTHFVLKSGETNKYEAADNNDAITKSERQTNYGYGTGIARSDIRGGTIHAVYGGSNKKGNIRETAMSVYEASFDDCPLKVGETYGAGKDAPMDGEVDLQLDCVKDMPLIFGGAKNADVNADITLNITNGTFEKVFGGNNTSGAIAGSITVNIMEKGCQPIIIEELYGGGYLAPYSIYGYQQDPITGKYTREPDANGVEEQCIPITKAEFTTYVNTLLEDKGKALVKLGFAADAEPTQEQIFAAVGNEVNEGEEGYEEYQARLQAAFGLISINDYLNSYPKKNPLINVISATRIDNIYGGGYRALVAGSPHVNVNMEKGMIKADYLSSAQSNAEIAPYIIDTDVDGNGVLAIGSIGNIYGGGNEANIGGDTYVEVGTGQWLNKDRILETIGIDGKTYTYEEKTTNVWKWYDEDDVEASSTPIPTRKAAIITGNIYGGGKMGHIGDFTFADAAYHTAHPDVPVGKPYECVEGTGTCNVTISNGEIGPDDMTMTNNDGPDDAGHVFGAGQGTVDLAFATTGTTTEEKIAVLDNLAYVNKTEVIVNGTAFVKGSVFGGSENGHVLNDTHVTIDGNCQIGNGYVQMNDDGEALNSTRGVNRPYTAAEWAAGHLFVENDPDIATPLSEEESALRAAVSTNYKTSLPECASWPYESPYAPHDKFANAGGGYDPEGGAVFASDGHTFYGNVFGGGSGYYPAAPGVWVHKAGWVEGNTLVEIKGGHVLTSIYGGNEMTNVGHGISGTGGKCTVLVTGGSLGVKRTLGQIAAHPVTCYLFGAGKGDQITKFNTETNVKEVEVEITGGNFYGSVFGGGEDGHVLGNVKMTIGKDDGTGPTIGTWGTSYVDGNIFGGGRGFSGQAFTAGNVGGSIDLDIKGGTMLGSIYGGGRLGSVGYGLYKTTETDKYGIMRSDNLADDGTTAVANFKRGYIDINISGGTIGNDLEYKNYTFDIDRNGKTETAINTEKAAALTALKAADNIPNTEFEQVDSAKVGETTTYTYTYRLKHTKGGNVFTGGMGRRTALNGSEIDKWWKLGNTKSTKLTITGGTIKSNVYGGGEFGAIVPYEDKSDEDNPVVEGGTTTIDIQGGTIGTEVKDEENVVKYTYGGVFGGGYGTEDKIESVTESDHAYLLGALVKGNSTVSMSGGHVWASVFGGGELAAIGGNTNVTISGGEIGKDEVKPKTDSDPGYVMFGGATMGNVYGGGRGNNTNTLLGVVLGNTNVTVEDAIADATYAAAHDGVSAGDVISSPKIYHNVYGGGALGSVGTFVFSDGVTNTKPYDYMCTVPKGIPLIWTANTGKATVNIKGGTIGISGRDNGMVDGSSRGGIAKPIPTVLGVSPTGTALKDPYDKMAWVESSEVNIGTENATTGPHIKGSVYGGGENGHVFTHATVNMMSGTIGIVDDTDPWYDFGNTEITQKARGTRGNIYGAGCGTDMYDSDDDGIDDTHNAWAGCVIGNTEVNISGGVVAQNVYGGGSMGSVGRLMEGKNDIVKHEDATDGFALSWPVRFTYQNLSNNTSTGKATINITGGRIGTTGSGNGDVFGGTRGEAGDRYAMAQLANVRETEVNINYPNTPTSDNLATDVDAIAGSVYGGSENGHVYEDTHVTLTNGLIGHSIYGGGKGEGQYVGKLIKVGTGPGATPPRATEYTETMLIYDWLAGKVYGNTHLTIVNGRVLNNVMGGGYMASVGKGSYSGGADDFYTPGYGETITGNLWTSSFNPELAESNTNKKDWAWYFLNSGICYVNVFGGNIGSTSVMEGLPAGNVFGGSHGMPAPSLRESSRHLYNPEWLNGYTNETYVTIGGGYKCIQTCKDKNNKDHAVGEMLSLHELQELFKGKTDIVAANGTPNESYWTLDNVSVPKIWGSVYGGSQDGRIRRDAHVIVNAGDIGLPYTDANRTLLDMENKATSITSLTNDQLSAELDDPQWLHRGNVYGAGSGLSKYKFDVDYDGDYDSNADHGRPTTTYYGNPFKEEDYCQFAGSVIRYTQVDILGGTIHRNVYGGGSVGSVGPPAVPPTRTETAYKPGTTIRDANYGTETIGEGWWSQSRVNIKGTIGTPDDYTTGFKYNPVYGGEVFGACRGDDEIIKTEQDKINFATTVWTMVHIMNGATIMGNVFGGGDAGMVKKDSEVLVGEE